MKKNYFNKEKFKEIENISYDLENKSIEQIKRLLYKLKSLTPVTFPITVIVTLFILVLMYGFWEFTYLCETILQEAFEYQKFLSGIVGEIFTGIVVYWLYNTVINQEDYKTRCKKRVDETKQRLQEQLEWCVEYNSK